MKRMIFGNGIISILILGIVIISFSYCSSIPDKVFPPEEEKLICSWQEIGAKKMVLDSSGKITDAVETNAAYIFFNDHTYSSRNDAWTNAAHGTWAFDPTYKKLLIYPVNDALPDVQRQDTWEITFFDSSSLKVNHQFEQILPDKRKGTVHQVRNFKKND